MLLRKKDRHVGGVEYNELITLNEIIHSQSKFACLVFGSSCSFFKIFYANKRLEFIKGGKCLDWLSGGLLFCIRLTKNENHPIDATC
jgi:hypothetical protein